jgi:hypothetical protein
MKKIVITLFVIFISAFSFAQTPNEVRASMGIDFVSVPDLKNYLEANYTDILSDFRSAVNFSGSYGRMIGENNQLEIELGYLLSSYNASSLLGNYDLTYSLIMPSLLYQYVINGKGYNFKFGGGAGLRILSVIEKLPSDPNDYNYSSVAYGVILRVAGNTAIAENVYAHIGADVRYDIIGKPDENATDNQVGNVDFSSLSFGIRLGISYQF